MRIRTRQVPEILFWKLAAGLGHLAAFLTWLSGKVSDAQLWAVGLALDLFRGAVPLLLPDEPAPVSPQVPNAPASNPPVWLESPQAIEPPPASIASAPLLQYPLPGGKLH